MKYTKFFNKTKKTKWKKKSIYIIFINLIIKKMEDYLLLIQFNDSSLIIDASNTTREGFNWLPIFTRHLSLGVLKKSNLFE